MYGYDGQTFETFEEFLQYLYTKYGDLGSANHASITWWGEDLHGNYLYIDGVQQLGTEGESFANKGFATAESVMEAYNRNPGKVSADTLQQLNALKQTKDTVINGVKYTNNAMPLGGAGSESGGQVLIATKPTVSDNGNVFNAPNIMDADYKVIEEGEPAKWIGTLRALGALELPAWAAAAAPLLGVALGVGMYSVNPEFWEKVSRTLLPWAYDDGTGPKMPISVDEDGNVHTPKGALEALRKLFIDEGVYNPGIVPDYQETTRITKLECKDPNAIEPMLRALVDNPNNYSVTFTGTGRNAFWHRRIDEAIANMPPYEDGWFYIATFYEAHDDKAGLYIDKFKFNGAVELDYEYTTVQGQYFMWDTPRDGQPYSRAKINWISGGGTANLQQYDPTRTYKIYNTLETASETRGVETYSTAEMLFWYDPTVCSGNLVNRNSFYGAHSIVFGAFTAHDPVDGTTVETGAILPADQSHSLDYLYPDWAAKKINVISNPQGETLEDSTDEWYPLSLSNTNNSADTDNVSSTQTQTDAQEGTNTDPSQINQIAQAIQTLTETLTRQGILPENPTIPSDPSGDTPTPTPPVITGAGSDLIAIYNPTKAQIQAFNQFLWDLDPTNLVNWKKVIANPIDAVISLHMVYVTPITGESRNIKCGYIETTVASKIVTNQYVDIDCGTVDITEYFHNVWDYDATRIEIYLPFIGIVPLHVGDIMNSTVRVRYRVDVLTGTCLAQIIVLRGNSLATLYTYTGNCAVSLPLTSGSFTGVFSTLLSMGTAGLTGGVGGAVVEGASSLLQGRVQQNIQRSGSIGANAGAMGIRTPYIIINRNVPLDAYLYQTQYGYPANKTVVLGNMTGYTRVKDIHLSNIPCTDDELEQIERLLKEGVIFSSGDIPTPPVPDKYRLGDKLIKANGTYSASADGYYGYRDVTADLYIPPEIDLDPISITENGTYEAGVNKGYDTIIVNVPTTPVGGNRFVWDFTQSEVDTEQNRTAVLNSVTRDSNGALLTGTGSYINLGNGILTPGTTIEIELGDGNMAVNGSHQRTFMYSAESGIIYRSNGKWSAYFGSWSTDSSLTDIKEFNNSIVKIYIDYSGYWHVYKDNVLVYEPNVETASKMNFNTPFWIGSSSQSIPNLLVKKVTVY